MYRRSGEVTILLQGEESKANQDSHIEEEVVKLNKAKFKRKAVVQLLVDQNSPSSRLTQEVCSLL